jgi:hypothetical protein
MAKKKKKPKDKIRAKIKREKRLETKNEEKVVKFRCLECGKEEDIPRNVVEMLDYEDGGDLSVPPRFGCTECDGQMEPIYYVSVHGTTYDINKK